MKKHIVVLILAVLTAVLLAACGSEATESGLADGSYTADFITDSTMFHVNEAMEGKCALTIQDGVMTAHIVMPSQKIVNLFLGTAADAAKDGAELIDPTVESVTYSDNTTEDVYAFDFPVPALEEDFQIAILGTKGKWYDHVVSLQNVVPAE